MKVYTFLADGFETVEALCVVDILRRAKIDVTTVSIKNSKEVVSSHSIPVIADAIFDEVDEACRKLEAEGITPTVYTFPTVKPIDKETILKCAADHSTIITVEEHNLSGGFGSAVAEVLAEQSDTQAKLVRIALDDRYSCIVGSQKYLRQQYSIDSKAIIHKVKENY